MNAKLKKIHRNNPNWVPHFWLVLPEVGILVSVQIRLI